MSLVIIFSIVAATVLAVATGVSQRDDRLSQEADALKGMIDYRN